MKIGVLGTGFGWTHASIYAKLPEVDEIVVFGRNEEKLANMRKDLGVQTVTNIMDIINDPDIDLVDVCLPTDIHKEYVIKALEHGKHVFCETPVAFTVEDAVLMQETAKKFNKKLMVDLFIRFDAPYVVAAKYAKNKNYGDVRRIKIERNTAPVWGDLGPDKIVNALMMHDIDFVSQLLGETDEVQVSSIAGKTGESALSALLSYPNAYAEIQASALMPQNYPFTVSYEIIFEHAVIRLMQEFGEQVGSPYFTLFADGKREELPLEDDDCYYNSIKYTLECLSSNDVPLHDISAAIDTLKIAERMNAKVNIREI